MEYVVYCDESRHDGSSKNPYMAIGSLWVPQDKKEAISKQFSRLCGDLNLHSEIKWNKTSLKSLGGYQRLVDFFFEQPDLNFRVIVVDQRKLNLVYHGGDRELGFYKFYYELLIQWLLPGNQYLILLDFKQNKGADRYTTLRNVLDRKLMGKAWVSDLTIVDSTQSPLIQLCDLLTGAVASVWCNDLKPEGAKSKLASYIGQRRTPNYPTLRVISGSPAVEKFNVFKIDLK